MQNKLQNLYLADVIKDHSRDDARKILREFYSDTINAGAHLGHNSSYTWQWFTDTYKKNFKAGIELGCGQGAGVCGMRQKGFNVWGVDHAFIPKPWKSMDIDRYCCTAEMADLPFKDDTFDVVLTPDVLEHIPENDIPRVLNEMKRIGSDQYYALISLSLDKGFNDIIFTHITLKNEKWWSNHLLKAGFLIKRIDHWDWQEGVEKLGFAMEKADSDRAGEIL